MKRGGDPSPLREQQLSLFNETPIDASMSPFLSCEESAFLDFESKQYCSLLLIHVPPLHSSQSRSHSQSNGVIPLSSPFTHPKIHTVHLFTTMSKNTITIDTKHGDMIVQASQPGFTRSMMCNSTTTESCWPRARRIISFAYILLRMAARNWSVRLQSTTSSPISVADTRRPCGEWRGVTPSSALC